MLARRVFHQASLIMGWDIFPSGFRSKGAVVQAEPSVGPCRYYTGSTCAISAPEPKKSSQVRSWAAPFTGQRQEKAHLMRAGNERRKLISLTATCKQSAGFQGDQSVCIAGHLLFGFLS